MMMEIHIDVNVRKISWVIDVNEVDDRVISLINDFESDCFSGKKLFITSMFQWRRLCQYCCLVQMYLSN